MLYLPLIFMTDYDFLIINYLYLDYLNYLNNNISTGFNK